MNYWEERYQNNDTGWDIGSVSTPLKEYIDQLTNKNSRILLPGAGNGYEFDYLINKGFKNVFVIDIAISPLQNIAKRNPSMTSNLLHQDFFTLNEKFDFHQRVYKFSNFKHIKGKLLYYYIKNNFHRFSTS